MNVTIDALSIVPLCIICQTSHGFSSADQRAIILMVILTGIVLVSCYVTVIWYAIRTRSIQQMVTNIQLNPTFDNHETFEEKFDNSRHDTVDTIPIPIITLNDEKERY
jgi:c-di-AMP phosphodiesterase-like protein